ncbi:MAG: Hsp20 family protein [Clostridiales bacterium]|nr:Hsp20 family protein [Clostridiales bacterium]
MRNYLLSNDYALMDDLFNQFFKVGEESRVSSLKADVIKTQNGFEVEVEIPGFKKEEINVSYEKDLLTVWAERKLAEQSEENSYVRLERAVKVKRSFMIKGIDEEKITAKYENGVLLLTLPLKERVEGVKKVYIE